MPPFPLDLLNAGQGHAVLLSDEPLRTRRVNCDLFSLLRCQFRSFSSAHVLKVRHWFKMGWIAARSLAAEVIEFKSLGYFPALHNPGDSVRSTSAGLPVARLVLAAVPDPAWSGESAVRDGVEMISPPPTHFSPCVVVMDESDRLAFDPSTGSQGLGSDWSGLSASAFAEFRRLFSHAGLLHRLTLGGRRSLRRSPHSIAVGA
jgi:hypothetical protein